MKLKFKAKIKGKTVYSNGFMEHKDGTIIIITKQNNENVETSPIDKDTLCQFTGISDKNKDEIYNKDKLTDGKITYVVEYNTQNTGFFLSPISDDILDTMNYQKLGNGYYSRKDLELIEPTE
tara:strand:+ start:204 stop:569 length:366 start_codon:yes stop_codon:yes gene_type:complete